MINLNTKDLYSLQDSFSDDQVDDLKKSPLFSEVNVAKRSYEFYTTNDVFVKLNVKGVSYMNQYPEIKPSIKLFISHTKNK